MGIIWWKIFLILSVTAIIIVVGYTLKSRKHPKFIRMVSFILFISFFGLTYQAYIWYNKKYDRPVSKITRTDKMKVFFRLIPVEKEPPVEEYLKATNQYNRPVVIAFPIDIQIRFTDPISPNSPHAIIRVLFANKGAFKAEDMRIKWEIMDEGRRITPPDEWGEIIGKKEKIPPLYSNQNFVYLYGPEIGAYAASKPPNIELTLEVNYKGEDGKEYNYYCKSKSNPKPYPDRSYLFDILDIK